MMIISTYNNSVIPLHALDFILPQKMYRNFQGENMLSTGDEAPGARDEWFEGDAIHFISYTDATKKLVLGNVPEVVRMSTASSNWAVADLTGTYDISSKGRRISAASYIGVSGGYKGVCEFTLLNSAGSAFSGFTTSTRFVVFSPNDQITITSTPITTRPQAGWMELYYGLSLLYKRPDGVWNAIIIGIRSTSYPKRIEYRSYVANDPMGAWTAETGTNLFSDITDTLPNLVYANLPSGFKDKDGKMVLSGSYKHTDGTFRPMYIKFTKYLEEIEYHEISFNYTLTNTSRFNGDSFCYNPYTDLYYATSTNESVYGGDRYLFSSSSLNGPFNVVEKIFDGEDANTLTPHALKPTFGYNVANMLIACIGGELRLMTGGEGSNRSGNLSNHVNNHWRRGANNWELMPHPTMVAYHNYSTEWTGFSWANDHCGGFQLCADGAIDGKLYAGHSYNTAADTYQVAIGYYNLSDIRQSVIPPTFTTNNTFSVVNGEHVVGLIQATPTGCQFSISGGEDAALFTIGTNYGILRFVSPPDYYNPTDSDSNNQYQITVRATVGDVVYSEQDVTVSIIATTTTTTTTTSTTTTTTTTIVPGTTTLGNNLLALYEFDETSGSTLEDSLNSSDGTLVNSPTINQTGKINKAYSFASADLEYVDLNKILVTGFPFTFSIWLYADVSVASAFYSNNNVSGNYAGFTINMVTGASGNFTLTFGNGGGTGTANRKTFIKNISIPANTWNHIVVTASDISTLNIFLNNSKSSFPYSSGTATSVDWSLGESHIARSWAMATTNSYNGLMDQFGFWTRVLTDAEVTTLYNSGNGLPYTSW